MTKAKVASFDLAMPAAIWGLEDYSAAWLLVRHGESLLGALRIELLGRGVLPVADLQQLAADEFGARDLPVEVEAAAPAISVVVCTRDRPAALRRCLHAIASLDYPDYEVIVVDNGSSGGDTEAVVRAGPFSYHREDRLGLDNARNRGWCEARHDLVAYVDDDTVVDGRWLRRVARAFRDPGIAAVTGQVVPYELDFVPQVLFEAYGGMSKGFQGRDFVPAAMSASELIATHRIGVGANMAFRRSVLEQLGGFDPRLDVGTASTGGGDLDMFHRILADGLTIRYEPDALVWHQHRRDMIGLRRQLRSNGRSFGVYLGKIWSRQSASRTAVLRYAVYDWWAGWLLPRAWQSIRHPGSPASTCAWTEIVGAAMAPWAYWRTCSRRTTIPAPVNTARRLVTPFAAKAREHETKS